MVFMTNEQLSYAQADIAVVQQFITANPTYCGDWAVDESKWQSDPIDFKLIRKFDPSWVRFCEIKGRRKASTDYGDVFISKNKIDHLNATVELTRNYSGIYNCGGIIFYHFYSDNRLVIMDSEKFAKAARVDRRTMAKSMANSDSKREDVYLLDLFDVNGDVTKDVILYDMTDFKPIYNREQK